MTVEHFGYWAIRIESCCARFQCSFSNLLDDPRVGFVEYNKTRTRIVKTIYRIYYSMSIRIVFLVLQWHHTRPTKA